MIYAVNPTSGPTVGGTRLRIVGLNYGRSSGVLNSLNLGGLPCKWAVVNSDTEIECVTPSSVGSSKSISMQLKTQFNPTINQQCPLFDYEGNAVYLIKLGIILYL